MGRLDYSMEPSGRYARAMGLELSISPKHAREICRTIRGMKVQDAQRMLEGVIALKIPVPFRRYNRNVPHRKGLVGWDGGRFPQKAAREVLAVLKNAISNAEYKGLEADKMRVAVANTKKGRTIRGWMPRAMGRATPKNRETVSLEMILMEMS